MARGCPVVLARAGALPETGGEGAAYFDPLDVDELAQALARVVCDERERRRLREAGLARARQFSWEKAADATAAVYAELI
jgi:glycosyltransferase involved in cell wall biosynthesis